MSNNTILFYGAGQNALKKYKEWVEKGIRPACFVDERFKLHNTMFEAEGDKIEIISLSEALNRFENYQMYITETPNKVACIIRYLVDNKVDFNKIHILEEVTIHDIVPKRFLIEEHEKLSVDGVCRVCRCHPHIAPWWGNDVAFACAPPDRCIPVGRVDLHSFDEIWNGEEVNTLRTKIRNWDFSECSLITCATKGRYIEALEYIERVEAETGKEPLVIKFMHDFECNLHCLMCRDVVRANSKEQLELLNEKIDSVYVPMCKDADAVYFAGNGEPFASRHYRRLMTALAHKYPQLKFLIHTNGNLCNEQNCTKLGIIDRIEGVLISLNAASEETYQKIARGGKWERVQRNIEWISEMIRQGKINGLYLSFVVQQNNYKEMADFVRLAKEKGAKCRFTLCHEEQNSEASMSKENEVFHPSHPEFEEYCNILKDDIFSWEGCYLDPYSKYIRECCLKI